MREDQPAPSLMKISGRPAELTLQQGTETLCIMQLSIAKRRIIVSQV
jgi:hypothetical protein